MVAGRGIIFILLPGWLLLGAMILSIVAGAMGLNYRPGATDEKHMLKRLFILSIIIIACSTIFVTTPIGAGFVILGILMLVAACSLSKRLK